MTSQPASFTPIQCSSKTDDTSFRGRTTQCPNPATSNVFKKPHRPRPKARRSCLNCQRAHKTCGNKRPCEQCIKRGIPRTCVDGARKPPKYLVDLPAEGDTASLRGSSTSLATEHEFIAPSLLHTGATNRGPENLAGMRVPCKGKKIPLAFSRKSEHSSGADAQPSQSGQTAIENPHSLPGYLPHGIKVQGFTMSSGWSSTFFPYEMEEEPEELEAKAIEAKGALCADENPEIGDEEENKMS